MGTVLIADDEVGIVALVATVLRQDGFVVLEAKDGIAALQLAAQHPGPIDLLISDVRMPGLTGTELCERLRRERPETRCLLMSGYAEGIEALDVAFLAKPFRLPELRQRVREVLGAAPGQATGLVRCTCVPSASSSRR